MDLDVDLAEWADTHGVPKNDLGQVVGFFIEQELNRNRHIAGVRLINSRKLPDITHTDDIDCPACKESGQWASHHCYGCGKSHEAGIIDGPTKDCICDPLGAEYINE
jgi:hypothetical protein